MRRICNRRTRGGLALSDDTRVFNSVVITSKENRWVKLARSLHRRRQRYRERAMLVEGVRTLREGLDAKASPQAILLSARIERGEEAAEVASAYADRGVQVLRTDAQLLDRISDTEHPQGIVGIFPFPQLELPFELDHAPLLLVLDRIRDPGNMGTLIRSALGAGVDLILIAPECVDPYSPKVVRAAMGSHFHVPIQFLDWREPPPILQSSTVYAADMDAALSYDSVEWQKPSAIIVGNETLGLSSNARQMADATVGIPLAVDLESLNAAVAGSILIFEAARQRRR